MGENGYRPHQSRYVCGSPADDFLSDIRRVADTFVPPKKDTLAVHRNDTTCWRNIAITLIGNSGSQTVAKVIKSWQEGDKDVSRASREPALCW